LKEAIEPNIYAGRMQMCLEELDHDRILGEIVERLTTSFGDQELSKHSGY
jgi:hypothetical protein